MPPAQAAFTLFGDRVKDSTTFNSPDVVCSEGYGRGTIPPQRCSDRTRCKEGNSTTEPGICSRNILVAHAEVRFLNQLLLRFWVPKSACCGAGGGEGSALKHAMLYKCHPAPLRH